jgi:hypothetical protein
MKNLKTICVFCGASTTADLVYQDSAIMLGKEIAEQKYDLVYGGGKLGLMGLVATSALQHGGKAFGFIPEDLQAFEGGMDNLTELHIVDTMHTRKWRMSEMADAFVLLPGGCGSLDEFFEILTWRQIRLHNKPIIIVNINGYWNPLVALLENVIDKNFAKKEHRSYFSVVNNVGDVLPRLEEMALDIKNHQVEDK